MSSLTKGILGLSFLLSLLLSSSVTFAGTHNVECVQRDEAGQVHMLAGFMSISELAKAKSTLASCGYGKCTFNSDCCGGDCHFGECRGKSDGGSRCGYGKCTFNSDCCGGDCHFGECRGKSDGGSRCGYGECTFNSDCCGGDCHFGQCRGRN